MKKKKQKKLKPRNTSDRMMRMKDNGFKATTQVHEGEIEYSRNKERIKLVRELRETIYESETSKEY